MLQETFTAAFILVYFTCAYGINLSIWEDLER